MKAYGSDQWVSLEPNPVQSGSKLYVVYDGLLAKSGADRVYIHFGYDGWKDQQTMEMTPQKDGSFSASIRASADHHIDLCFKDSADHWDNNYGSNWRSRII